MIVWINGGFGSGKTSVSEYLQLNHGFEVFDPETVGFYLREVLPESMVTPDFQDIALWRSLNNQIIKTFETLDKHIAIPMTVTDKTYFEALTEDLHFKHIILDNKGETLRQRLIKRGDTDPWAFEQIARCVEGLALLDGHRIICDELTVEEVGHRIMEVIQCT